MRLFHWRGQQAKEVGLAQSVINAKAERALPLGYEGNILQFPEKRKKVVAVASTPTGVRLVKSV